MCFQLLNRFLVVLLYVFTNIAFTQNNHKNEYLKFIDLAIQTSSNNPKKAELYLDSIPGPLNQSIKGYLAHYYEAKVFINDKNNELAKQFKNTVLALKYAELENNYDIAGWASLEIFYSSYIKEKDSTAYKYIASAKRYYTLCNNKKGLAEVTQMYALAAIRNKALAKGNTIILEHLDSYKLIKDDTYYYMYALFLLTTNYIDLNNLNKAHKYFNTFKTLKDNSFLESQLYEVHLSTIYGSLGRFHFHNKAIDSTSYYLSKSETVKTEMNDSDKRNFYNLYIDYYDYIKDFERKNNYIDSLKVFENHVLKKTMEASFYIGDTVLESEGDLRKEQQHKGYLIKWLIILVLLFNLLFIWYTVKHKKIKKVINNFEKNNDEFTYLKATHEKLKVKVHGLEDFILEVKKEIKAISTLGNADEQRKKIKELLKTLHLDSSTLLDKTKNHLEIVNEFNVDFFTKIKKEYPQLSDSENIICYYLFVGFKSKEIAAFLNVSIRAVEGKRYRISKKMNLQESGLSLLDFIQNNFKDCKENSNL
ncbi:helix-turn-helix transcriptional regulator [Algibacter pacificus]|uniref:helix-turn-helix transcriptional regulator n=1 Tax=Algibacter pacificus TaxID=2599389 RepID=UPI0011C7E64D|nr:LuxR C-terminal-related transcriptional regulator [Algibacter pacificus]